MKFIPFFIFYLLSTKYYQNRIINGQVHKRGTDGKMEREFCFSKSQILNRA